MIDEVVSGKTPTIRQVMRVIPRWKAIENVPGVLPCEDIRQIFKASDPIVLIPCACKKCTPDRACKDKITELTCVTCGRAGEYNLKRGAGKKLTYDEVMELFDSLDQHQLVHLTGNTNMAPPLVCNCHNCCCGMFILNKQARKQLNQSEIAKSRFQAVVDPKKCKGCRLCADKRCPVGAAQIKYYPELGAERSYVNAEECIGCGLCVITCPAKARSLKIVRPPEHIPSAGKVTSTA
jgi:ferredoxin